jgi:hypothetical protein
MRTVRDAERLTGKQKDSYTLTHTNQQTQTDSQKDRHTDKWAGTNQ